MLEPQAQIYMCGCLICKLNYPIPKILTKPAAIEGPFEYRKSQQEIQPQMNKQNHKTQP